MDDLHDLDDQVAAALPEAALAVARCRGRQIRVATAESLTGGLLALAMTTVPGSAEVFCGGLVAYQSAVKRGLLGVGADSVVTSEAALQMARGALEHFGCGAAVSTTGVAGPQPQDGRPVGTCFVAVALAGGTARCVTLRLDGSPGRIRLGAARAGALLVCELLGPCPPGPGDPPPGQRTGSATLGAGRDGRLELHTVWHD